MTIINSKKKNRHFPLSFTVDEKFRFMFAIGNRLYIISARGFVSYFLILTQFFSLKNGNYVWLSRKLQMNFPTKIEDIWLGIDLNIYMYSIV